jgi:hypothetical protein
VHLPWWIWPIFLHNGLYNSRLAYKGYN